MRTQDQDSTRGPGPFRLAFGFLLIGNEFVYMQETFTTNIRSRGVPDFLNLSAVSYQNFRNICLNFGAINVGKMHWLSKEINKIAAR